MVNLGNECFFKLMLRQACLRATKGKGHRIILDDSADRDWPEGNDMSVCIGTLRRKDTKTGNQRPS